MKWKWLSDEILSKFNSIEKLNGMYKLYGRRRGEEVQSTESLPIIITKIDDPAKNSYERS